MNTENNYAWEVRELKNLCCVVKISEDDNKLLKASKLNVLGVSDTKTDTTSKHYCAERNSKSSHVSRSEKSKGKCKYPSSLTSTSSVCEVKNTITKLKTPVSKRVLVSKNIGDYSLATSTKACPNSVQKSCSNNYERYCLSEISSTSASKEEANDRLSINSYAQYSSSERSSTSPLKEKLKHKLSSVDHEASRLSQRKWENTYEGSDVTELQQEKGWLSRTNTSEFKKSPRDSYYTHEQQSNSPSNMSAYYNCTDKPGTLGSNDQFLSVSRAASCISQEQHVNSHLNSCLNYDYFQANEKIFYHYPFIQETFAIKLDKRGQKAYKLWLKCLEYEYSSGKGKVYKRNSIVKRFVKKDDVFNLSIKERNNLVGLGICHVKETAFKLFQVEFAGFLKSPAYKNFVKKNCSNSYDHYCRSEIIRSNKETINCLSMKRYVQYSPSERSNTSTLKEKMKQKLSCVDHDASLMSQIHCGSYETDHDQNIKLSNTSVQYSASEITNTSGLKESVSYYYDNDEQQSKSPSNMSAYYNCTDKPSTLGSNDQFLSVSRAASCISQAQKVNNHLNNNYFQAYEKLFYNHSLIQETFAIKLDKRNQKAYKLWLKCLEYEYSSGKGKLDKKNSIVKRFVKKDNVFNLSIKERNNLVGLGICHVKETAFKLFQVEFAGFLKSPAYKNMRK